jgi:hypothetical protein
MPTITLREKTKRLVRAFFPTREYEEKRAALDREAVETVERLERVIESPDYKCSLHKILDEVRQDRINEKIGVARTKGATARLRLKALEETENARTRKE